MKKIYTVILLSFILFSCQSDDDVNCTSEPAFSPAVFIELVNAAGDNLIENGTYIADDITIGFNESTFVNGVFTDSPEVANFIGLNIFGEDGDNTFEINLSDTETDILVLNINREETGGPCSQSFFTLNSVTYNGESKELQDFRDDFLITVVKE